MIKGIQKEDILRIGEGDYARRVTVKYVREESVTVRDKWGNSCLIRNQELEDWQHIPCGPREEEA